MRVNPLGMKQARWHSIAHYRANNIVNGKTQDPRDSSDSLTLREVDAILPSDPDSRAMNQILAADSGQETIRNLFHQIKKRVELFFKKTEEFKNNTKLKKNVLDFIDTLDWKILDKPSGDGQYVTGIMTEATFDKKNFNHTNLVEVLNFLYTHMNVADFLDDKRGLFIQRDKVFLSAGQLALNFTEVSGKNILRLIEDKEELARFMTNSNAIVTYCNGDVKKNHVLVYDSPLGSPDVFMNDWQPEFNNILRSLSEGDKGISNFKYSARGRSSPSYPGQINEKEPSTISDVTDLLDHTTSGYIVKNIVDAYDAGALFILANEEDPPELLIHAAKLPEHIDFDDFKEDLERRFDRQIIIIDEADDGDIALMEEQN